MQITTTTSATITTKINWLTCPVLGVCEGLGSIGNMIVVNLAEM